MTTEKALTLSLIIPVYNEESHLKACLDSVARQTIMPDEVIVVDNNSTDRSFEISKSYKFVKIISESRQGYILARNTGFNIAKGDILARIDADSTLATNWVERVKWNFRHRPGLAGVTGFGLNNFKSIYSIPFVSKITSRSYFWYIKGYLGVNILWGANMAITSSWWRAIRKDVCLDWRKVHEDQDLSLLVAAQGGEIYLDTKLYVNFDGAKLQNHTILSEYLNRLKKTKQYHLQKGTYSSTKLTTIIWPRRTFYRLITSPAVGFFKLTSFLYAARAKSHIKAHKRQ